MAKSHARSWVVVSVCAFCLFLLVVSFFLGSRGIGLLFLFCLLFVVVLLILFFLGSRVVPLAIYPVNFEEVSSPPRGFQPFGMSRQIIRNVDRVSSTRDLYISNNPLFVGYVWYVK